MGVVKPTYELGGTCRTYEVSAAVTGGQVVMADAVANSGKVIASTLTSLKVLGVAQDDADLLSNISATDATAKSNFTAVWDNVEIPVTYSFTANWRDPLKAAASGQVALWVSGTDLSGSIIGHCAEKGGVTSGNVGLARIRVVA